MSHTIGRIPLDPNRRTLMAGVSSADGITLETAEINPSTGRLLVDTNGPSGAIQYSYPTTNPLASIVSSYAIANNITLQYAYQDDFSQGFQGWQYQYDTANPGKAGLTLTEEARMGNYALELHTPATANAACWARKGMVLPNNLKKIIFGCYFTIHAENVNNPQDIAFDFDTQFGDGTATGSNRYFFSVRYLNYLSGLQQKWQVQTGTATSQAFTDVTAGAMPIPWNESAKPMLGYLVFIVNYATKTYETLYSNGNTYDLTALSGPTASADLTNFDQGLVNIMRIENRGDSTIEGILSIEKSFLAWGF